MDAAAFGFKAVLSHLASKTTGWTCRSNSWKRRVLRFLSLVMYGPGLKVPAVTLMSIDSGTFTLAHCSADYKRSCCH